MVLGIVCCGVGVILFQNTIHQVSGTAEIPAGKSYNQWRNGFKSNLVKRGPSPQGYSGWSPSDAKVITYDSDGMKLKAWLHRPRAPGPRPALVFFHGGFALGEGDLEACRPAMDAGFVVMAPSLRGENGNPGNFELFLGEVNDARAATKWLAQQNFVDKNRIYGFGHSVGGGVSAMLSLLDDVPIQHSGSSGGLYPPSVFWGWADITPFKNTPEERSARLLIGNIKHMQRPHYAYLGYGDSLQESVSLAQAEMGASSKLTIKMVHGDHFTSFDASLEEYLKLCR